MVDDWGGIAINADHSLLATIRNASCGVRIYRLRFGTMDGDPVAVYNDVSCIRRDMPYDGCPKPRSMCFTAAEGTLLIAGCKDGIVEITTAGAYVRTIARHDDSIQRGVAHCNQIIAVSAGGGILLVTYKSNALIRTITSENCLPGKRVSWRPMGLRFTSDGRHIVVADAHNDRVLKIGLAGDTVAVYTGEHIIGPSDVILPLGDNYPVVASPNIHVVGCSTAVLYCLAPLMLADCGDGVFYCHSKTDRDVLMCIVSEWLLSCRCEWISACI